MQNYEEDNDEDYNMNKNAAYFIEKFFFLIFMQQKIKKLKVSMFFPESK